MTQMRRIVLALLPAALVACSGGTGAPVAPPPATPPPPPRVEEKTAMKRQQPAPLPRLRIARDVASRLGQFAPTDVDFDEKLVSPENRKVLAKLVAAARVLDDIFVDQVSPENRSLRQRLVRQGAAPEALAYFDLMCGPWDRLQNDKPFVGTAAKPKGAGFYPPDLTKKELEAFLKAHPQDAPAFKGFFTVITRRGGRLVAVPYSKAYAARLKRAAGLLREAAALTSHPALKRYLELRAAAFLSDDYYASDVAWMDLGDSPLEVVIGPYEVYEDRLMGYKAAFEAFITLRDPEGSARLKVLMKHNEEVERHLPLPRRYHTKRGTASPVSVVIELFTAGDTRAGVQTAAFNLPNDERVRTEKGSKKVMLKNVIQAKFQKVLIPIAREVVDPKLIDRIDFDTYFTDILLHEVAHGMGPGELVIKGRKTSVNAELKELYPAIEEAKADIVGLVNGAYLAKKKALPRQMLRRLPATYLAGVFRAVRFGTEEAHGKAVLLAFNYLREGGAITYDPKTKRFSVNERRFWPRVRSLAHELLMVEARGSYADAKKLIEKYGEVSPEMRAALQRITTVPVDIRPRYTVLEKMKSW